MREIGAETDAVDRVGPRSHPMRLFRLLILFGSGAFDRIIPVTGSSFSFQAKSDVSSSIWSPKGVHWGSTRGPPWVNRGSTGDPSGIH